MAANQTRYARAGLSGGGRRVVVVSGAGVVRPLLQLLRPPAVLVNVVLIAIVTAVDRRRGRQLDALLIDAGFAYVSGAHNLARLLRGAYPWMAPELIEAYQAGERGGIDKAITVAADVYAAGILVAEVFSGRQAFADARDVADLLNRKRRSTLAIAGANPHHEHLDLGTLGDAVTAATNPDPGSRPATIPAFIDALKRAQPAPAPAAKAA